MDYGQGFYGMSYLKHHNEDYRQKSPTIKMNSNYNNNLNEMNQHISWNGTHQYGNGHRNPSCQYDYKLNMGQQYSYNNIESNRFKSTSCYDERYDNYQMYERKHFMPNTNNEYSYENVGLARCTNYITNSYSNQLNEHHLNTTFQRIQPLHRNYELCHSYRPYEVSMNESWYQTNIDGNNLTTNYPLQATNSNMDYAKHLITNANQYSIGLNGQSIQSKDDKWQKIQRDRSLSKLVAMNRRLETQLNENKRNKRHEQFIGFDDFTETVDSSASMYLMNKTAIKLNGNDLDGGETNELATVGLLDENHNEGNLQIKTIQTENPHNKSIDNQEIEENLMVKQRRKRRERQSLNYTSDGELKMPLPGFQQAFGSTEIGRFSEIFFTAGSLIEMETFEEDALSPQAWETGDSLDGPHFRLHANTPNNYAESLCSTDSPTASNKSYFSELHSSDF